MPVADRELDELRQRVARLEVALAAVEFETSFWGRVLRLVSVAAICLVVMLCAGLVGPRP